MLITIINNIYFILNCDLDEKLVICILIHANGLSFESFRPEGLKKTLDWVIFDGC
jgi:hypothetical protein